MSASSRATSSDGYLSNTFWCIGIKNGKKIFTAEQRRNLAKLLELGNRIRKKRIERGWTQEELAEIEDFRLFRLRIFVLRKTE